MEIKKMFRIFEFQEILVIKLSLKVLSVKYLKNSLYRSSLILDITI